LFDKQSAYNAPKRKSPVGLYRVNVEGNPQTGQKIKEPIMRIFCGPVMIVMGTENSISGEDRFTTPVL
jgi:hypothetical protein